MYTTCAHVPLNSPPPAARTKTTVLEATVHPHAVHAVVRLLEVEESEAPMAAIARGRLLKPVHLLEVKSMLFAMSRPGRRPFG